MLTGQFFLRPNTFNMEVPTYITARNSHRSPIKVV